MLKHVYLGDEVEEIKHKYEYYYPIFSFDKTLALEEANSIYDIINNNFNLKKTILGIIARENMSKEFDINTIEEKHSNDLNEYLCIGKFDSTFSI